ncbi:kinase [Parapedobacter sp. DT-150]|uniref:kinase n=1 Tax=Parapedobacter sp. DT-150 TaxID=3396162 RepID=UPI003F1BF19D
MDDILYYPYINVPKTQWTLRTLLYYDSVGSIVPGEYFYDPERLYDPFMLELVRERLVVPINPLGVLDNPWRVTDSFLEYIAANAQRIRRQPFRPAATRRVPIHDSKFQGVHIHGDKFGDNLFDRLQEMGLAERGAGRWFHVEPRTAGSMMAFLASVIGEKTERLPTTDVRGPIRPPRNLAAMQQKRETILRELIPFPENIDLYRLRRFKDTHRDLLMAFKNRVEMLTLDPQFVAGTDLFNEQLRELTIRRDELAARMDENQLGKILFGTVCGLIGAFTGLISSGNTWGGIAGALPGFANAVHGALQIERAENTVDQSGLKYLALLDKRLSIHKPFTVRR